MSNFMQLGQMAVQAKNTAEAIKWFTKAVETDPKNAQALSCLGQTLCWQGKRTEGLVYLHNAGKQLIKDAKKSKNVTLPILLAEQLQHWDDYTGALDLAKQVVQINSKDVAGFRLLAVTYLRLNQIKQALAAAQHAHKLAPNNAIINILLAPLEAATGQREQAAKRLENVLKNNLSPEENYRAHKELALILDKLSRFDDVFAHLHAAAEAAKAIPQVQEQDANLVPNMLKAHTKNFTQDLLSRWAGSDFADTQSPVFLIGFLRSGTTMTQEVLDAHPDVFVSDETDFIPCVMQELARLSNHQGSVYDQLQNSDLDDINHLRQFYWQLAKARYGDKAKQRCFVDKTTMNTIDLGFINSIFPDAKVLFLLRDPRDVLLSCYMQIMIPTASTVQLLSWQGAAEFYAQTMNWWQHIKQRMNLKYLEFKYEDAVTDFEGTYRKVFDFIGLDWNPAVVNFHQSAAKKHIVSPSFNQVTQPLYNSSVARWRRYEKEFEPINGILQSLLKP
jgi:tetratricopeptide (TPR) repeat protein